jgi:hypothetical protein
MLSLWGEMGDFFFENELDRGHGCVSDLKMIGRKMGRRGKFRREECQEEGRESFRPGAELKKNGEFCEIA